MTLVDWGIVVAVSTLALGSGAILSRETKTATDWFLAGRALPFWAAGLSMFATSLDAGELIAVSGYTYGNGIAILSHYWLGLPIAFILASFFVLPRIYRAGIFTNAEYLEARFSKSTRLLSVFVQVQYRTNILASMTIALHLVFTDVVKLSSLEAWGAVIFFATLTTAYAAFGGLKTMARVDIFLSLIMIAATSVFWFVLMGSIGNWSQLQIGLENAGKQGLLHIGGPSASGSSPLIVLIQWIIIAVGFVLVNHTQTMKMLGARSLWDLRLSVLVVVALTTPVIFLNGTFGVMAHTLLPEEIRSLVETRPDRVFPQLADLFLGPGLKGLVVAGVVAAAISTYEGIGSALGALVTRDFYARLLAPAERDSHYLRVSQIATCTVVALSFAYVPFILAYGSLMDFFLRITNIFVTPLMTLYLVGSLTRAGRRAGLPALIFGSCYGIASMLLHGRKIVPDFLTASAWTYLWSFVLTAAAILVISWWWTGWEENRELAPVTAGQGWSSRSRSSILAQAEAENAVRTRLQSPVLWSAVTLLVNALLVFWFFW